MATSSSLSTILLISSILLAAAAYFSYDAGDNGVAATTHLHFYMHDDYTGPHPTAMRVVSGRPLSPNVKSSPRQFGDIVVLNNVLTEGPRGDSARVGSAQGFAVRVAEHGAVSDLSLHLVMEAGVYKGSSVTMKGRIDMDATVRESVVVGGTGHFRFARGYVLTRNYDYDMARGGIVEIDVYVH